MEVFVFDRNLQHLIDEIIVIVEFDQCLLEQLDLHVEVHTGRTVKADQPGMDSDVGVLPFGAWLVF